MSEKKISSRVVTPEFRVSFPSVFQAKMNDMSGKEEYSVVALFPKNADLSALKALAQKVIQEKWPDGTPSNFRSPFRNQGEKKKTENGKTFLPDGYEDGAVFINLKSQQKPGVVDGSMQPILSATDFYPGCYARASVSCYAYDIKGNRGVAFGLGNIQKVRDGEAFGGRSKPEEDFAPIAGAATSQVVDPFAV